MPKKVRLSADIKAKGLAALEKGLKDKTIIAPTTPYGSYLGEASDGTCMSIGSSDEHMRPTETTLNYLAHNPEPKDW